MEAPFLISKPQIPFLNSSFILPRNHIHVLSNATSLATSSPKSPKAPPFPTLRSSKHLLRDGAFQDAILALDEGSSIDSATYISLLKSCIDSGSIDRGRKLHASIGLVRDLNPFVETKLVSMYAKCGTLAEARRVFDEMRVRDLFAWSAMINGYAREQLWMEVIRLFFHMMHDEVALDKLLFPRILQACANTGDLETGRLLHSLAVRGGALDSSSEAQVGNATLAMYAKCGEYDAAKTLFEKMLVRDEVSWNSMISAHCQCGEIEEACRLFERMRNTGIEPGLITWNILIASYNQLGHSERAMELMKQMGSSGIVPDVFTWTSMISGFVQNNRASRALGLFVDMQLAGVQPNGMTIASVISACASLKSLSKGKELHSLAFKIGGVSNVLVGNALVDMYAKCERLEDAQIVFDVMQEKDVFTWNSMIAGYMRSGTCGRAYDLFCEMEGSGVRRNTVTWNVMISGYLQNEAEDQAMELFQRMEMEGIKRNTASWNALIAGTLLNGHADVARRIFRHMQSVPMRPSSVTILSVLPACANLISSWKVREIHACILRSGFDSDVAIANCLIDSYSKSGDMDSARTVFDGVSSRDLISWNSIISGCVLHGRCEIAGDLFSQMKEEGIRPNHCTFSRMISAYSLSGMVREGEELFSSMAEDYQQTPSSEHYVGMVHLYGRSGRLAEAAQVIEQMPIEPDSNVWTALLTAARVYGNYELASLAAEHLIKLDSINSEIYRLLLQQIQALHGNNTNEGSMTRKARVEGRDDCFHGCCWMEVGKKVHTFFTGIKPAEDLEFEYAALNSMAAPRHFPNAKLYVEEEKEEIAGTHSEKLAMAFGLKNSPRFRRIQIIKSARMCTACHTAGKLISKTRQREILLKDPSSLHHFNDGKCSCRDYW